MDAYVIGETLYITKSSVDAIEVLNQHEQMVKSVVIYGAGGSMSAARTLSYLISKGGFHLKVVSAISAGVLFALHDNADLSELQECSSHGAGRDELTSDESLHLTLLDLDMMKRIPYLNRERLRIYERSVRAHLTIGGSGKIRLQNRWFDMTEAFLATKSASGTEAPQ